MLDPRFQTNALHQVANCPKLGARRTAHLNNFMFSRKSKCGLLDVREIGTRAHDAPLFKVKIPTNETYKRSVEYYGAVRWNSLPKEVCNIENAKSFKQLQKKELMASIVLLS